MNEASVSAPSSHRSHSQTEPHVIEDRIDQEPRVLAVQPFNGKEVKRGDEQAVKTKNQKRNIYEVGTGETENCYPGNDGKGNHRLRHDSAPGNYRQIVT